jgi:dienelactone hydrolase
MTVTTIDERLLRHLYAYDRTLPLLATSEPEPVLDMSTRTLVEDVRRERVTFGSTHDERVLVTLTYPAEGGPHPSVVMQHGSTPLGRHSNVTTVPTALHWAREGMLVASVDAYGFGSRETPDDRGRLRPQRPDLMFRTRDQRMQAIQDLMRTVDYLLDRPDIANGAIAYHGVSMGCRIGVPFFALDERVCVGSFFVGGAGSYSRFVTEGTDFEDLVSDEELIHQLTDPAVFAPLTGRRPTIIVNGARDELVTKEGGERLQALMAEPVERRWFDGGHAESPPELVEEARAFLAQHLGEALAVAE